MRKSAACMLVGLGLFGCGQQSSAPRSQPAVIDQNQRLTQFIDGLKAEAAMHRALAAIKLGEEGAAAKKALPQLEELAKNDPDPNVKKAASEAVAKLKAIP